MRAMTMAAAIFVATAAGMAMAQTDPGAGSGPPAVDQQAPEPQTATTEPQTEDAQPTSEDHRIICRTVQNVESRIRRARQRICGTRAEWEHMQDENARAVRNQGRVQGEKG